MQSIKETGKLKIHENWVGSKKDLSEFLDIGDAVDDEMVDYFIGVLPPACMSGICIQIGEPHDHKDGKPTFATLIRQGKNWIYAGNIHTPDNEKCFYLE